MNLQRLGGRRAPLDPENPIIIEEVPRGAGFKDGFKPIIKKSLDDWEFMLDKLAAARKGMMESSFKMCVIYMRNDSTGAKCKRYLGFDPRDGDKCPPCETLLATIHDSLDVTISAIYEANKSSMFSMKK